MHYLPREEVASMCFRYKISLNKRNNNNNNHDGVNIEFFIRWTLSGGLNSLMNEGLKELRWKIV